MPITVEILRSFFGWCAVVNLILYSVMFLAFCAIKHILFKYHSVSYNVDRTAYNNNWQLIMGQYRTAIFLLNVAPYIALRIIEKLV